MDKKRYYLILEKKAVCQTVSLQTDYYQDITEIDLWTMKYSKEEFMNLLKQNLGLDLESSNLYIMRIYENKKKEYDIRFYDCIFKTQNILNEAGSANLERKIFLLLEQLAMQRMKKTQNMDNNINGLKKKVQLHLDNDESFKTITYILLNNDLSNNKKKKVLTRPESIISDNAKGDLLKVQTVTQFNGLITQLRKKYFYSYKEIRAWILEYFNFLNHQSVNLKEKNFLRKDYLYPSFLFDYTVPFFLSIYDATHDLHRQYVPPILPHEQSELMVLHYISSIKRMPIENPTMRKYYLEGGVEMILNEMDANDIYKSSDEDLLRVGLISEDEFLEKNPNLNLKK